MYVKVVLFIGSGVRYMLYSRLKVELVPIGVWGFGLEGVGLGLRVCGLRFRVRGCWFSGVGIRVSGP